MGVEELIAIDMVNSHNPSCIYERRISRERYGYFVLIRNCETLPMTRRRHTIISLQYFQIQIHDQFYYRCRMVIVLSSSESSHKWRPKLSLLQSLKIEDIHSRSMKFNLITPLVMRSSLSPEHGSPIIRKLGNA